MTYQPPSSPPSIKEAMKTIDSMLDDSPNDIEIGIGGSSTGLQGGHPVDIMPPGNTLTPTFDRKGKFQSYEQQHGTTPTTNSNNIQDALTLANQIESSPYGFHFDKKSKVDIKEEIRKKEEEKKKQEQEVALQQMMANPSGMNWDDLVASMKKKKKKKSKKKSRKSSRRSRSSRILDEIGSSSASGVSPGFRCSPIDESIDELDEEDFEEKDEEEQIDFQTQNGETTTSSPYGIGNGSTFDVEYGGTIPEDVDEIDFHPPTYDNTSSSPSHTANGMTVADQINELIEECQIPSDKAYEMVVKYEGQEMVLLNNLKEMRERMLSSPENGGISHSEYTEYNMSYDTGINNGYTNKRRRKCAIGFAILVLLAGIVGGVMVAVKNSSSNVPEEFSGPSTAAVDSTLDDTIDQVQDADRVPTLEGDNEYSGEYDDISSGYETGQGADQVEQEAMEATKEEFQQQHPELDGETPQETVIKEEIEAVEDEEGETNAEESDIIYPWSRQ